MNRNVEPKTVLIDDDGRVMLDPYDHPIRNFGNELPIIISSEIQGWEVENYLRRNHAIKVYDLVGEKPRLLPISAFADEISSPLSKIL